MKLQVIDKSDNLLLLELGRIHLFSSGAKSMYLVISENEPPKILVLLKKSEYFFSLQEKKEAQELYDNAFVVPKEIHQDLEKLKDFILNCETSVLYSFELSEKQFEIDEHSNSEFHWSYKGLNRYSFTYPMRNLTYVQMFKTEKGAKRSLIKYLEL